MRLDCDPLKAWRARTLQCHSFPLLLFFDDVNGSAFACVLFTSSATTPTNTGLAALMIFVQSPHLNFRLIS
jgi:hypothetical protein